MVDVPRPQRRLGSLMIDTSPYHTCRIIADPETCDECRRYAQELAANAALVVMNNVLNQLPPSWQEDGLPALENWIKTVKARSIPDDFSREQKYWFTTRYAQAAKKHYDSQGFRCNPDIAAVVVVFELAPVTQMPVASSHTSI